MRELHQKEMKSVCGGNPFALAAISLGGAYYFGNQFGTDIYQSITSTFGMSPGQAGYYTFSK